MTGERGLELRILRRATGDRKVHPGELVFALGGRPPLDRVMARAWAREVDAVLTAAFDRFGRSLPHLVRVLEEFRHLGVGFDSLREQLDLSSLRGRVMFSVIAAMADFERELIRERVQAGLRRARAHREPLERPPRVFHRDRVLPLR